MIEAEGLEKKQKQKLQSTSNVSSGSGQEVFDRIVGELSGTNIHALLVVRKIKQIAIAKKYNLGVAEVNKVIHGQRRTRHIREAIAGELGLSVEQLWKD